VLCNNVDGVARKAGLGKEAHASKFKGPTLRLSAWLTQGQTLIRCHALDFQPAYEPHFVAKFLVAGKVVWLLE
jgi:hypothetical protein